MASSWYCNRHTPSHKWNKAKTIDDDDDGDVEKKEVWNRGRCEASPLLVSVNVVASSGSSQGLSRRKTPSSSSAQTLRLREGGNNNRIVYDSYRSESVDLPFWQQTWFLVFLLLMGLSFLALALFLYISLGIEEGSPIPTSAGSEGVEVYSDFVFSEWLCCFGLKKFFFCGLMCVIVDLDDLRIYDQVDAWEDEISITFTRCAIWVWKWAAVCHRFSECRRL